MFTGLVEEKGILKEKITTGDGFQFVIEAKIIMQDLQIGSSVAVNGCCLTVVKIKGNAFAVDTIEETLNKTNLGVLKQGMNVNLERPLAAEARLGGHFVLGHIDTTGKVEDIKELSNSHWLTISFPEKFKQYLIYVGSVAIDGVSMTVADLKNNSFSVGIIPHTWKETIFSDKKIGDTVNLEFDVLGKYVERIMESKSQDESSIFLN
ncbi:MAG: riboflavin synthase [Ignavibacteriales bacterium]|nr:riboflavin synthase [Ignavibacteriales bacterium]